MPGHIIIASMGDVTLQDLVSFAPAAGEASALERSAAAAVPQNIGAVLTTGPLGQRTFEWTISATAGHLSCPGPLASADEVKAEVVHLGSELRPLDLLRLEPKHPRGALVYFGGGPGADHFRHVASGAVVRHLLGRHLTVYVPNYSGSLGAGPDLVRRLAVDGPGSIDEDVRLLSGFLREQGIDAPYIVGESLGGIPAAALSRAVRGRIVFIVPLIRFRDLEEWVEETRTPWRHVTTRSQRRFESAMLDMPAKKQQWSAYLSGLYGAERIRQDALFVFGTMDTASRPDDLFRLHQGGWNMFSARTGHAFTSADVEVQRKLDQWLGIN